MGSLTLTTLFEDMHGQKAFYLLVSLETEELFFLFFTQFRIDVITKNKVDRLFCILPQ